jgi:hypothetical protein
MSEHASGGRWRDRNPVRVSQINHESEAAVFIRRPKEFQIAVYHKFHDMQDVPFVLFFGSSEASGNPGDPNGLLLGVRYDGAGGLAIEIPRRGQAKAIPLAEVVKLLRKAGFIPEDDPEQDQA